MFKSHGKAGISALLVAIVLLLDAMAASPALHKLIHKDADSSDHECAVTMFAHGQVDSVMVDVSLVAVPTPIETTPRYIFSVSSSTIEHLPNGRGPPVLPVVS